MVRFQFATLSALLAGIAFAGGLLEAFALFTHEPIGFWLLFRRGRLGLLALPLLIMAGPMILLRDLWELDTGSEAETWVKGIAFVAVAAWAIASGHLLLRLIELVQGAFGI